jgi:Cu-Zn family superoxide dismutase
MLLHKNMLGLMMVGTALVLSGCSPNNYLSNKKSEKPKATAIANVQPTQGNTASGNVWFEATANHQLKVHAVIKNLPPDSEHGFHVHEKGDCSSPDATSAGGHFNPLGVPHGAPSETHHGGDMPILKANASGVADAEFVLDAVTIDQGVSSLVGRAVIVHAATDDYKTQPTGNSGARLACGVVELSSAVKTPGKYSY